MIDVIDLDSQLQNYLLALEVFIMDKTYSTGQKKAGKICFMLFVEGKNR